MTQAGVGKGTLGGRATVGRENARRGGVARCTASLASIELCCRFQAGRQHCCRFTRNHGILKCFITVSCLQFMGKDNIPFHTIIFPATLLGTGKPWTMMERISVTEYLNYEGGKFSKSRGVGVFGNDAKDTGIPVEVTAPQSHLFPLPLCSA